MTKPPLGVEQGRWSTEADEDALFDWLESQRTPTVSVVSVSAEGRPMRLVTYGDTTKPTLLLVGGQHGYEPDGRETLLWLAREMAAEGLHQAALRDGSVAILPNANPDGREAGIRGNSYGVDPNRDHLHLVSEEGQAINTAVRTLAPVMVGDFHQYGADTADVWLQQHIRESTHPLIAHHGDAVYSDMRLASIRAGHDTVFFPLRPRLPLSAVSSLMHMVGILVEARWRDRTIAQRTDSTKPALHAMVEYFTDHVRDLHHAQAASRAYASQHPGPDIAHIWDSQATEGSGRPLSLSGYRLSEPLPQKYVEAHGIEVDGLNVPIRQPARGVIIELLDPEVEDPVVPAVRVSAPQVPAASPTATYVQIGDSRRPVTRMVHQTGGQRRTVRIGG